MVLLLGGTSAWAASPCPFTSTSAELAEGLSSAEVAYTEMDVVGFQRSMDEVALILPCIEDQIAPEEAAQYHRMRPDLSSTRFRD